MTLATTISVDCTCDGASGYGNIRSFYAGIDLASSLIIIINLMTFYPKIV